MFPFLFNPYETEHFLGFLPPGSGSASVHADTGPEGISLSESGSETLTKAVLFKTLLDPDQTCTNILSNIANTHLDPHSKSHLKHVV